jgi:hypothetical protein
MKVIMLLGPSEKGKTTTFNMLYATLAKWDYASKKLNILSPKVQLGSNPNDFECTLSYKGKTVGLFSMGDESKPLTTAMFDYLNKECDVFICACNKDVITPQEHIVGTRFKGSRFVYKSVADPSKDEEEEKNIEDLKAIISYLKTMV